MKAIKAIVYTAIAIGSLGLSAAEKLKLPTELDGTITNVYAGSKLSPKALGELSDRSKCGVSSEDLGSVGLLTGLSTRPASNSTEVLGDTLDGRGIWRAMYWSRHPDTPVCAFRADPNDQGSNLQIYGIRHSRQTEAVSAIENGRFFCKCASLSK